MIEDLGELLGGRYRILAPIGRGGMGVVWRAWDSDLDRTVAIKELRLPEQVEAEERQVFYARMEREARAAARLKHPGIITVYDRVAGEDGRPWIVMEYIEGGSLHDLLTERERLPVGEVAQIGVQMLDALRLAHGQGIVHRDIKPANVLLEGRRVVLTDFGIAALDGDATLTQTGAILGTPAFMAPEQVRGRDATPESDLWSLGATLFAAAEGGPPFTGTNPGAVFVAIATEDPAPCVHSGPLSEVLTGLLNKDPAARLTADRAHDLLAALATEAPAPPPPADAPAPLPMPGVQVPPPGPPPVQPQTRADGPARQATPDSSDELRPQLIGALAAVLVAAVVIGAAVLFWPESDNDRLVPATGSTPLGAPPPVQPSPSPEVTGTPRETLKTTGGARSVSFSRDGTKLAGSSDGGSIRLWNATGGRPTVTMKLETPKFPMVAFRPDGKSLISGQWDGSVRLWNVASRSSSVIMSDPDGAGGIAMSPDGTKVARSEGKKIRIFDVPGNRTARTLSGHTKSAGSVAFSPDGRLLASSSSLDNTVRIWDVASGRALRVIPSEELSIFSDMLAFSPDGKTLAKANDKNSVQLWDVATGSLTKTFTNVEDSSFYSLAFSPDGKTLATGTGRGLIKLWDVAGGRVTTVLAGHDDSATVNGLAFRPDGRSLASAGSDDTVRLWVTP
ncbi:WD40 repeat domain-containing serine/threonine protein kinase [Actinomadura rugatobispora]|uniref:WD40 repeat domain-containing serine/threonine protein kinase n=1 Tax=Actinomadura rugatobispora TaxID=1994 RepID=A0ABW0ZTH0_9ACTN